MTAPIRFKFHFLNSEGQATGFLRKKGSFDGKALTLDKRPLDAALILRTSTQSNRIVFSYLQPLADGGASLTHLPVAVSSGNGRDLARAVNVSASHNWAARHEAALKKEGRAAEFRAKECPHCACTVDLTGHPPSPQLFCTFCDTIATVEAPYADQARLKDESAFGVCSACGYYSMPRTITCFYFYFLLVVYGFRWQQKHMCHTCMRREAWKMLAGNALFLLGVPVAITQLVRAYAGGAAFNRTFAGLDRANALAKAGKAERAAEVYEEITSRLVHCAGVRYNRGLAFARAGRFDEAGVCLSKAIEDCANFAPAAGALAQCYEQLGMTEELKVLQAEWNHDEGEQAPP